jgi:WD40 repeat protein
VQLWDSVTGAALSVFEGHLDEVVAVIFSPDNMLVASASWDKTIRLWYAKTGTAHRVLEGHLDGVTTVAFSPNSKLVASGSWDKTVKLWDAATGAVCRTLHGHSSQVRALAFSPDGELVASASADKTIRLWEVNVESSARTIHVVGNIHTLRYVDPSCLQSNLGYHQITPSGTPQVLRSSLHQNLLSLDHDWIKLGSTKILWLPPRYRGSCSDVFLSTIAIGCTTGRVTIVSIDTDELIFQEDLGGSAGL